MGMFDTFYGEVQCPYCGKIHEFEEQTKNFDCMLDEFRIGDYIDKGNINYIYKFEWFCDEDKNKTFNVGIAIRRGQIVKLLINDEINELENSPLESLNNIEDGLGKRLLYEKICREANGTPKEHLEYELNPLPAGSKFIAFGVEWDVIRLYRQKEGIFIRGTDYYYEVKSKEHGFRILYSSKRFWNGRMEIITLECAKEYSSLYFDEERR